MEVKFNYSNYPYSWCYGIVNGIIKKVINRSDIVYQAENEELTLIIERHCIKRLLNFIKNNYPNMIFKIYQKRMFSKSEKYYYCVNGELLNFTLDSFYLITIPSIKKSFVLFNIQDLKKIKEISNYNFEIKKYINGSEVEVKS